MKVETPDKTADATSLDYWRFRFEQQKYLVGSMSSLLKRYGSSVEPEQLYGSFLLTLMGQFATGDACYYEYNAKTDTMEPVSAYGALSVRDLPRFATGSTQLAILRRNPFPSRIEDLETGILALTGMKFLSQNYRLFAPLFLKEKIVGALFLGEKVTGTPYTSSNLEVLNALCAVSATTFNNAHMYKNARQSAREIRKLYNVRDEVISRITHEFRTPLTIMKAGVEILAKDNAHEELVRLFSESERRLEDLINSLLSLSEQAIDDDAHEYTTDGLGVLHECIHACTQTASHKNIQINLLQKTEAAVPPLGMNPADLRMVLNALLENGIKFSPPSSVVTVEVSRSPDPPASARDGLQLPDWREQTEGLISEYQNIDYAGVKTDEIKQKKDRPRRKQASEFLVIRISDNGIGIPEDDVASVVEPFRQASNSPDLGIKGSGLGLALAHKTVSLHGGYLCCRSTEGTGTTFSVFLPLVNDLAA